ncbi:MAG: IS4 family transposase, partial [Burkholderiales bacterium]
CKDDPEMNEYQTAALSSLIIDHIRLARSRRETLGWLMTSVVKAGSVNLNRLAPHIDSAARTASVHRRLERFFDEVELNEAEVARLVVHALGLAGKPWHLALDRTNWQFGKTDLNILVLSVAHDDVCVPLFWRVLDKAGNSNAAERIDLMQTCKDTFPDQPVASLTGDREFIGNAWIAWLQEAGIPHFLRLREDMHIFNDDHAPLPLQRHAARLKNRERMSLKGWWRIGASENNASPPVRIVILRLETGELLTIASRNRPKRALAIYRKRWKIETLFAALKTRGFNLETTHMTDPDKLAMLMAILAMAASVACKVGLWALNKKPRRLKAHGRPARSLFALGLDAIRTLFAPRTFIQSLQVLLDFLFGNPKQNLTQSRAYA